MLDYIRNSSASFTEFLKQTKNLLKTGQGQFLISFVFPAERIEIETRLNSLCRNQELFFYAEKPSEGRMFFGIDSVLTITEKGEKRFSSLDKAVNSVRNQIISNRRDFNFFIPLFLGGMKFTIEHSDNDWKDFDDSGWFIPELLYLKNEEKYYFVYNIFVPSKANPESIVAKFESVLKQFFSFVDKDESKELRLLKISGNEPKDKKKWRNQVNELLEKIEDGELQKVVLSRRVELIFTTDILVQPVLKSLAENYPQCTLFIYHKGKATFLGASPETLVRFQDREIQIEILAGSTERGTNEKDDLKMEQELLNSSKDLTEHNLAVNYVKNILEKSVETFEVSSPSVQKLKNIQHLKSLINVSLNDNNSIINLIGKIHPSPAVGGIPVDTALNMIKKIENHQRGLYAGLIGWFNLQDEGEMILAIRSALAVGNKLIAYAGCGLVKGSNPEAEFKETELKLKPFLSIFKNEN